MGIKRNKVNLHSMELIEKYSNLSLALETSIIYDLLDNGFDLTLLYKKKMGSLKSIRLIKDDLLGGKVIEFICCSR